MPETKMKVGILGSGDVAKSLARGCLAHDYDVMLGTRDRAKLDPWVAQHPRATVGSFADAARFGDVVVLAVKGTAAADALRAAGANNFAGKPIIDATNPIADAPPANGVLKFFTTLDDSLMERLQREFPQGRFVKAFNSVGNACMVDPRFKDGKPTMFICGDDEAAKRPWAGSWTNLDGRLRIWVASKPRARSSPSASYGASPAFCARTGCMRSSCCAERWPKRVGTESRFLRTRQLCGLARSATCTPWMSPNPGIPRCPGWHDRGTLFQSWMHP